jgi:serine/threonine protein kinase
LKSSLLDNMRKAPISLSGAEVMSYKEIWLDDYHILEVLNRGERIDICRATHPDFEEEVAIKILFPDEIADERERRFVEKRFYREAYYLMEMDHPHIVKAIDYGKVDSLRYLVMEHAPHGSLAQKHSPGKRLSLDRASSYVGQIGAAIQYLHSLGLIHRDIKPGNIFVGARNRLLLGDFGLVTRDRSMQQPRMYLEYGGTRAYMAPEQLRGEPCQASDQYALATMVFEWLTGCSPFDGNPEEITQMRLNFPAPAMRAIVPEIPAAVDTVVMTALRSSPHHRYPSIQKFIHAFEEACTPASAPARPSYPSAGRSSGASVFHQHEAISPHHAALLQRRAERFQRKYAPAAVEEDIVVVSHHSRSVSLHQREVEPIRFYHRPTSQQDSVNEPIPSPHEDDFHAVRGRLATLWKKLS